MEKRTKAETFRDIATGIAAALVPVFGVIITYLTDQAAERNRLTQARADLLKHRELVEINTRRDVYPHISNILSDTALPVRQRLDHFKLFMHNFHDLFNGRAVFDALYRDAMAIDVENPEREQILRDIDNFGRDLAQQVMYDVSENTEEVRLSLNDSICVKFPGTSNGRGSTSPIEVQVTMLKIDVHYVYINVHVLSTNDTTLLVDRSFHVRFYDTPLTDNILLPDNRCLSITLKDIDANSRPYKATLNVTKFHPDFIPEGFRRSIKDVDEILKGEKAK